MIDLWIPGEPPTVTAQQKGVRCIPASGRMMPMFYKKPAYKQAEAQLLDHIPQGSPFKGPVAVRIELAWPWRKAEPKKNRMRGWRHKDTKPDLDNTCKLILDCLTKKQCGFSDDAQVTQLEIEKTWADEPGTRIRIWALEGPDGMPLWTKRNDHDDTRRQ